MPRLLARSCAAVTALSASITLSPAAAVAVLIEGYASTASVVQGDTVGLHIRTLDTYRVEVEHALDPGIPLYVSPPLEGTWYPVPDSSYAKGCGWPVAVRIPIDPAWESGMYYARLVNETHAVTTFAPFVVLEEEPGSTSNILFQCSTNTYQAYNYWGGKSLYGYNSTNGERAHWVSYDRPYLVGASGGRGDFPLWEEPMARWLRDAGISVEYCTNVDLHLDPDLLQHYDLFMSVGHDEYYSKEMYDHAEAYRDAGGNIAYFSGNTNYWGVRLENNARRLVCYKDYKLDPYYDLGLLDRVTDQWRRYPLERPEAALIGVMYRSWCYRNCGASLRPVLTTHWTTRGLGLAPREPIGVMTVGYEWDESVPGVSPSAAQIIFESPVEDHRGDMLLSQSTYYESPGQTPGPARCRVFAAGTIQWSWGVYGSDADPRLQAITGRIIRCLSSPQRLTRDLQVVFRADASRLGPAGGGPIRLYGNTPPLGGEGSGVLLRDDGEWPDDEAGDDVHAAAVTFPTDTWVVIEHWYGTRSLCTPGFFSAWVADEATLIGDIAYLTVDELAPCPTSGVIEMPGAADEAGAAAGRPAGRLGLTVRRAAGGLVLELRVPDHRVGQRLSARIVDVGGRTVRVLDVPPVARARQRLRWDGLESGGRRRASGIYFARVTVGGAELVEKVVWFN